jgi:poly(3-hydroxybutyrate) depolymerase
VVTFCPAGLPTCRDALVINADEADGHGPLSLHWHGTFESPHGLVAWDWAAQQIAAMVQAQAGLMVLPYADPTAVSRASNPFPWWVVCGPAGTQCGRPDDFVLADEIVACAVEQELVDPERLTTSGMSAGGIMTSHLVDRSTYFAGAVSWSGGLPEAYQPTTPPNDTAVMALHGGPTDVYCGVGANGCYEFAEPSEALAEDVAAAGNFAFLCDHQAGHSAAMGGQGAQFLSLAHADGHPWATYPFGSGGNWMLDHYCYLPGEPSPWE